MVRSTSIADIQARDNKDIKPGCFCLCLVASRFQDKKAIVAIFKTCLVIQYLLKTF